MYFIVINQLEWLCRLVKWDEDKNVSYSECEMWVSGDTPLKLEYCRSRVWTQTSSSYRTWAKADVGNDKKDPEPVDDGDDVLNSIWEDTAGLKSGGLYDYDDYENYGDSYWFSWLEGQKKRIATTEGVRSAYTDALFEYFNVAEGDWEGLNVAAMANGFDLDDLLGNEAEFAQYVMDDYEELEEEESWT
jgi:hypothetical protein